MITDPMSDAEAAALFWSGVGTLAYGKLKPGAVVLTDYDEGYEPIRHVIHHTYEGRLAWFCTNCARVSLDPVDGSDWTCCGSDDGTAVVSDPIECSGDRATCLSGGTDWCECPDRRTLALIDALAANGVRATPMGSGDDSYSALIDREHFAASGADAAWVTWQAGVGWTLGEKHDPGGSDTYLDVACDASPAKVAEAVKAFIDGDDSRLLAGVPERIDTECGRCSLAGGSSPVRHQFAAVAR